MLVAKNNIANLKKKKKPQHYYLCLMLHEMEKKGKSENRNIFKHDHLIELCFSGFVFISLKKTRNNYLWKCKRSEKRFSVRNSFSFRHFEILFNRTGRHLLSHYIYSTCTKKSLRFGWFFFVAVFLTILRW
jgi:hypothetical protein